MEKFEQLPKSVKKAIRYIRQNAPDDKIPLLRKMFEETFEIRKNQYKKKSKN